MGFSLVIISYNGKELLSRCLRAVFKSSVLPQKIIVVDDFSNDGTEKIKDEFKDLIYIKNQKNLGPTASRNVGAKLTTGEYIVFLDNDALVKPDCFEKLISFLDNNIKVGIVGTRIIPENHGRMWWNMGYDPNNFRESIGYIFGFLLKFFPNSRFLKNLSTKFILNYWDYGKVLEVDWVVEPCFIIRKDIFNKIGGFDEQFFMFFEGPDLCRRVRQAGFKVYFNPEAKVDLLESHTHNSQDRNKFFNQSKYRYYKKHHFYLKSNPVLLWLGKIISGLFYKIA